MMDFTPHLNRARAAFTVSDDALWPTVLQYALVEAVAADYGGVGELTRLARNGATKRSTLHSQAQRQLSELQHTAGVCLSALTAARVLDLALDTLYSEPLAPDLLLLPYSLPLPSLPVHALIFTAFPHVTNELYPLMVDAYVAAPGIQMLGVQVDWLEGSRSQRAIRFDRETLRLVEADLTDAPTIASAQVLALGAQEAVTHAQIAGLLQGIPLLNPVEGACLLDDKATTARCWQQAGLPTPDFLTLPDDMPAVADFLATHPSVVLKPIDGTEGRGVERLPAIDAAARITERLATGERLLLCEDRGSARYSSAAGPVPFTVRLNVCWDRQAAQVESSYAQVAALPDGIASAGRGGRLIALTEVWASLSPTTVDWERLVAMAAAGTWALGEALGAAMPALIGLDVLLDYADGQLRPVLLEANPRPAGMSHSRFVAGDGPTDEPGVSLLLPGVIWQRLAGHST